MQINRLLEMVYLLLTSKTTAKQLSEHFNVSIRTIYRDIDVLSSSGIPVYTQRGKGGGIYLLENFTLTKSLLTEQEQTDILLALQNLAVLDYPNIEGVFSKLTSLFKKESSEWLEIDLSSWGSTEERKEMFTKIKLAILEQQMITFTYVNNKGEYTNRKIAPIKMSFKKNAWYLKGYCDQRNAERTFKISRISNLEVTHEEHNQRNQTNPENIVELQNQPVEEVALELKISSQGVYRVFDEFEGHEIAKQADGSFIIKKTLPGGPWLLSYLLSFGELLKDVQPPELKTMLQQTVRQLSKNLDT